MMQKVLFTLGISIVVFAIATMSRLLGHSIQYVIATILYPLAYFLIHKLHYNNWFFKLILSLPWLLMSFFIILLDRLEPNYLLAVSPLISSLGFYILFIQNRKNYYHIIPFVLGIVLIGFLGLPNWKSYVYNRTNARDFDVPHFEFTSLDGKEINNATTSGKIVVLDFWTTSCSACFEKFPDFNAFYNRNKHKMNIYSVYLPSAGDKQTEVEKMIKEMPYNFPFVLSTQNYEKVSEEFKFEGVPNIAVIDKTGIVRFIGIPQNENYIWVNNYEKIALKYL